MAIHPRDWNPRGPRGNPWEAEAIFAKLREIAPNIAFTVTWEEDPNFATAEGLRAHDVDVYATAVQDGNLVEGREGLGEVYSKPGEHDPDVHGYLLGMLERAAHELSYRTHGLIQEQAKDAKKLLKKLLRERHNAEQRRGGG